jgi:hypothetical protein
MKVKMEPRTGDATISALEGELIDQAALLGVLNSLYELHLPVVSVICLPFPQANDL